MAILTDLQKSIDAKYVDAIAALETVKNYLEEPVLQSRPPPKVAKRSYQRRRIRNRPIRIPLDFDTAVTGLVRVKPKKPAETEAK